MAKTYRKIQQWDAWLAAHLGSCVLEAEHAFLKTQFNTFCGKEALIIGTPRQQALLENSGIFGQTLVSPLLGYGKYKAMRCVESEFYELSIHSGSIDVVILPHTLELVDNPHRLLTEAFRIVRPEGHIIILGFNQLSLWGFFTQWQRNKQVPWSGRFVVPAYIKKWIELGDFDLKKQDTFLFRPPVMHKHLFHKLKWLEWLGHRCWRPLGGVYGLVAQAKVIPLTPIKLSWKQKVSDIQLAPFGIPRPSIRNTVK